MKQVFLDANVLFTAAHNPGGKAALVVELAAAGHCQLFTSEYAHEEARRNLTAKYPHCLPQLAHLLSTVNITPSNLSVPFPDSLVPKDAAIFQAAVTCKATHLLTGDLKHFGHLMKRPDETFGITVHSVADFLSSL